MAIRLKDIADRLGVNRSTVSRALNGSPLISPRTRKLIQQTAQEMGYAKSAVAQSLVLGKTNCIGVVFPPVADKANQPFFMKVLTAINREAREAEVTVSIASGHTVSELKKQVELMYSTRRVDGFVVLYAGESDKIRDYLLENKVPFVLIGTPVERKEEISYVDNDNKALGAAAANYLATLGHRELTFVTDVLEGEVYKERYDGFLTACNALAIQTRQSLFENSKMTDYSGSGSALVVMDDILALRVISELQLQNIRVPEDISIVSFNNSTIATIFHPYLTSFDINVDELGYKSVDELLRLTDLSKDKTPKKHQKVVIPYQLVERETVKAR